MLLGTGVTSFMVSILRAWVQDLSLNKLPPSHGHNVRQL